MKNKHNRGHQKLRGSAFSLHLRAKTEGNILLVKRSYKYCSILAHFPESQYTQTLRTLITQEFIKLLIFSTLKESNASLSMELDTKMRVGSPLYIAKILAPFFYNKSTRHHQEWQAVLNGMAPPI